MKNRLFPILTLVVLLAGSFVAGRVHAAQNRMVAARDQLRAAHHELQSAVADKGGHRERALDLVSRAIAQVDEGINFARAR
ncbi:MAG TPA: hypothetical protein VH087_16090 [Thermoanaerobaculia bacterium]|jgi:hypothetical protein|nr:hypothetical protein [Thermoanaerobaculia bacterium]